MQIGIDIRLIGKKRTGDEAVFFNLVKNLAKIDSENEYLLFTDTTDTTLLYSNVVSALNIENSLNFKIIPLAAVSPLRNKFGWNFWTLPNYLRKNPVDAYLTQYITPWFVPRRIKILTIIHDISFNFYPRLIKFTDLLFLKILIPLSLRRADKIIAVSQFTKEEIIKFYGIREEKIVCVQNAVADGFVSRKISPAEEYAIRKKYNIPEKYILYLGTMQPRKNLPALIGAFAKVRKKLPEVKLVLAGKKGGYNYDFRIDEAIAQENLSENVIFTGYVDKEEKGVLYKSAAVFCFPSLYEGFGIPILESMSWNVPVVCSDILAHREVAENAALYFHPVEYVFSAPALRVFGRVNSQDLDDLANKLYNVIIDENLKDKLATLGKIRVSFFSWRKTADEYLKIFESLN